MNEVLTMHTRHNLLTTLILCGVLFAQGSAAGSLGDLMKQLGSFSFGQSEFDPNEFDGNRKDWQDRDRWVEEALSKGYQTLERSDKQMDLFDFQNYYNVLSVQWTRDYLIDPKNIGNLNAYATFTEYLSRYLKVKHELISSIATLNEHYAILKEVDPRQLSGPFQLNGQYKARSYTQKAAGSIDATTHEAALAASAGAVEKYTAELNAAIDYGLKLESYFKQAAGL
jgi:hypothetical protein